MLASPLAIGGLCLLATAGITAGVTSANAGQASNTADTAAAARRGHGGRRRRGAGAVGGGGRGDGKPERRLGDGAVGLDDVGRERPGKNGSASKVAVTSSGRLLERAAHRRLHDPAGHRRPADHPRHRRGDRGGAADAAAADLVHLGRAHRGLHLGRAVLQRLPADKAQQIPAQYADVGVKTTIDKVVGATSVVESLPGTPNAATMASRMLKTGYHGCWVIALGTNDTADVAVGSEVSRAARIKQMMALIGNQPVMWVEVKSLLSSGPYAEPNMELWNQALQQALPSYPNMRLYNWPAVVQNSWYINDGIHFTSVGYAHRGQMIAEALAEAFPAN